MKICHIISMPDITHMGSITQEIYNRCEGDHIWDSVFNVKPKEADIYIMHNFRNHADDFKNWEKPKDKKLISLIHSCWPCMPHPKANEIVTITKAWQNIMYSDYNMKTKMIRGAIDLTEYLKVKPNYDNPVIVRIGRPQEGKINKKYFNTLLEMKKYKNAKSIQIMKAHPTCLYYQENGIKYYSDIKINENKKKAELLSKCNIYADAHSDDIGNLFMETFCVALLEGMASGLATIILGQYQPAMRELLTSYGIVLDNYQYFWSYLYKLCESKDMRQHYGELARERAKEFDLNKMVSEWNELIKSLL